MRRFLTLLLFCCAAALFAGQVYFQGDSEKNPLTYRCGEEIVFRLTLVEDGKPLSGVPVEWSLFGEDGTREKGKAVRRNNAVSKRFESGSAAV